MQKVRKVSVANGIYWIEIPDAGLYVMCGCPADSVKHLMKRGLIHDDKRNGVTFETGPNAILLSDELVQNGRFANLAEFPVLQMLYRQGMILPGHPNNNGSRPIIIGVKDQVDAQLQYIFRGNYGLTSEEELIDAGLSVDTARELMRMKLRFAFGKIRYTDELLETRIVEDKPVEIRNGVFIHNLSPNEYEFQYEGESVAVNMNLAPNETYEAPFSLGFYQVEREYFSVIHSGDGDGWDVRRPCMASIVVFQGKIYLIDAGPNMLNSLFALGLSINRIEGIFHTHAHDDHFADLALLMQSDHRIKYYTTPPVRTSVQKKLSALVGMDEESFADYFEIHDLALDVWNNIGGLEVKAVISPHPVETSIFIFRTLWANGYKSYAHLADIASFNVLKGMVTQSGNDGGISQSFFDEIKENYLTTEDLKKIDVGGGMIHGMAEDFLEDKSGKMILSHTALAPTLKQKEIASGAAFGMADVLIPANQSYIFRYAYELLPEYFPHVPAYYLRMLLNNPIVTFNPESIILHGKVAAGCTYLVLTGNVAQIDSKTGSQDVLSAGAMVGEHAVLVSNPVPETYRSIGFVQALQIPNNVYRDFLEQNGLYDEVRQMHRVRQLLLESRLFKKSISYPQLNKLARAISFHTYPAGDILRAHDITGLNVIMDGALDVTTDTGDSHVLRPGDFFGAEYVLSGSVCNHDISVKEAAKIYEIPADKLCGIPVVRWRLVEAQRNGV